MNWVLRAQLISLLILGGSAEASFMSYCGGLVRTLVGLERNAGKSSSDEPVRFSAPFRISINPLGFLGNRSYARRLRNETPNLHSSFTHPQSYKFHPADRTVHLSEGSSQGVTWEAHPFQTVEEMDVNGRRVIAAQIYEFFGYTTSEPRVAEINGKSVVLEETGSGMGYDYSNPEAIPNLPSIRALTAIAAYVGSMPSIRLLKNDIATGSSPFLLTDFERSFGLESHESGQINTYTQGVFTGDESIDEMFQKINLVGYSVDHPLRLMNVEEAAQLVQKFRALTDSEIRQIANSAQLSPNIFPDLLANILIQRRNTFISMLVEYIATHQPDQSLIADARAIRGLIPAGNWHALERESDSSSSKQALIASWDEQALAKARRILQAYAQGKITDHKLVDTILDIFGIIGQSEQQSSDLLVQLFRQAVIHHSKGQRDVTHIAFSIFRKSLRSKNNGVHIDLANTVRGLYHSEHSSSLGQILSAHLYISDSNDSTKINEAIHKMFDNYFELLKNTSIETDDIMEIIILASLRKALDDAELYDGWLSEGGGFHNAQRVSANMEASATIIEWLKFSAIKRDLTREFNLDSLIILYRGLKYNDIGRRQFGGNISPLQAFGLDPAGGRTLPENPYQFIRDYYAGDLRLMIPAAPHAN